MTDRRDNRGKRHDFHFVLFGVLLATMAGKVLIAEIQRFLVRHHRCLCSLLAVEKGRSISDAQLRRVLALVDQQVYEHFHAQYRAASALVGKLACYLLATGLVLTAKNFVVLLTGFLVRSGDYAW